MVIGKMLTRPKLSILHMNQRWAKRKRASAAMDLFKQLLNRSLKISSLPNPRMTTTPAMEEEMWWITGDFMMLSNFFASSTPEFIVKSSRTNAIRMKANPIRK